MIAILHRDGVEDKVKSFGQDASGHSVKRMCSPNNLRLRFMFVLRIQQHERIL